MQYSTQVDLVLGVAHEHLVHAKVLDLPECIEDQLSPSRLMEPFIVCCVGARCSPLSQPYQTRPGKNEENALNLL